MRILIADDDVTSRNILTGVLRKSGYEVEVCVNGTEAWSALQKTDAPRMVVLDWRMPEMDGLEVIQRVRDLKSDHPHYILMLTGRDEKADVVAALEAGANDYLTKPFDLGELRARITVGQRMVEMQSALIASRDALALVASHDSLTGLLNRGAILDRLAQEQARSYRNTSALAVGMCDIDHFKQVNDQFGHLIGDEVLRAFARILSENLRPYDSVGRLGGEEFLVIISVDKDADIVRAFNRLSARIAESQIATDTKNISVTVSIGVVRVDAQMTVEKILAAADTAMYEAKHQGRNRVIYAK